MQDLNESRVRGRLTKNPELTSSESSQSRAVLNVCTNYRYTNAKGEKVSKPSYHRVVVFGPNAENAAKYLSKGHQVEIDGRSETREYKTEAGERRWITEIIADVVRYGEAPKKVESSEPVIETISATEIDNLF